jgi:hypothetical protein
VAVEPDGGDPACWLDHVCDRCGRFVDDTTTHHCDAPAHPPAAPASRVLKFTGQLGKAAR